MKLEPQLLRDAADGVALGSAAIEILIGVAVIVALCTAMAALFELRRGIAAPGRLADAGAGRRGAGRGLCRAGGDACGVLRAPLCRPCLVSFQRRGRRRTAFGARFNDAPPTAAHRRLPFGTRLRVSRGGPSVVVTVNDRGD